MNLKTCRNSLYCRLNLPVNHKALDKHGAAFMIPVNVLAIITLLSLNAIGQTQALPQNRYPEQIHFEDSTHIFCTYYPNPFSPPTVTDTGKGLIYGGLTFYCDISDSVEVAFVTSNDSIVNRATVTSKNAPHFSVGYWLAGPNVREQSIPRDYFRSSSDSHLKLLLMVDGRWKSLREIGITAQKGWYYWIDDPDPVKQ